MSREELGELAFLSDVCWISGDGEHFALHKAVLAKESRFFFNAFQDLSSSSEFSMKDEPASLLSLALSHVCDSREPQPITESNVCDLVEFFSKYDVSRGMIACDNFLSSATVVLSTDTLPKWMQLADQQKLPRFLKKCLVFAEKYLTSILAAKGAAEWMQNLAGNTLVQLLTQRDASMVDEVMNICTPSFVSRNQEHTISVMPIHSTCSRIDMQNSISNETKTFLPTSTYLRCCMYVVPHVCTLIKNEKSPSHLEVLFKYYSQCSSKYRYAFINVVNVIVRQAVHLFQIS